MFGLLLFGLVFGTGVAADGGCSIAFEKIDADGSWKANDTGANRTSVFEIQVNELPRRYLSSASGPVFEGMACDQKHMVQAFLNGKRLETFFVDFRQVGWKHARIYYRTFYGTWQLEFIRDRDSQPE